MVDSRTVAISAYQSLKKLKGDRLKEKWLGYVVVEGNSLADFVNKRVACASKGAWKG